MDGELLIIRAVGSATFYVGAAIAGIWLLAGVLALLEAWRAYDPRRSSRRKPESRDLTRPP